jgi:hypothetical protein
MTLRAPHVALALALALGGDCLADVALLRVEPALFGLVASDPTVSRLVDALAAAGPTALTAIRAARSLARQRAWSLACRSGWPPFRFPAREQIPETGIESSGRGVGLAYD